VTERKCTKCKKLLPLDAFKKVGGSSTNLRGDCSSCRNNIGSKRFEILQVELKNKLSSYGCCVCGITNAKVLEVHHLHKSYKRYGRSQSGTANLQDIEKGVAVVLCANDHSLFHSHFGGKNASFPPQTKESTILICQLERSQGGL
jgi:hypothetical protein